MSDKSVKLLTDSEDVVSQIIETQDVDELKKLTQLFNINQVKKDALRAIKLNDILDKLDDQVLERVNNNPDQFSNNDLLNYINTIQQSISKTSQSVGEISQVPLIQINQQNNIVNLEDNSLNRESRQKIIDAVKQFLEYSENIDDDIIDLDEENIVYNNEDGV